MKKTRSTYRLTTFGVIAIPLIACLLCLWLVFGRNVILAQAENAAKATLETTLANLPPVPGDVVVHTESGIDVGGTDACMSYVFEQLHGTDSMEENEVLDYYDKKLLTSGWIPSGTFYEAAHGYSKSGNIYLSIYPVNQGHWWYNLYPFGSGLFGAIKYPPPRPTLEAITQRFKTVFAFELVTFPPEEFRCADK